MKKIILLLMICLLTTSLMAQVVMEWEKSYGGSQTDELCEIIKLNDGGIILAGNSNSNNGDVNENNGNFDCWVVKIDAFGNIVWEQNYGGGANDRLTSCLLTSDGGLLLQGQSISIGYWVIKTDAEGNIEWDQGYVDSTTDSFNDVVETDDGGFLLAGFKLDSTATNANIIVVKIDQFGNIEWQQIYEAPQLGFTLKILKINDGGFLIGGSCILNSAYNESTINYCILKIDNIGNIQWEQNYGGSNTEQLSTMIQTDDGGFLLGGVSHSSDGDVVGGNSTSTDWTIRDLWIVKVDNIGNIEWSQMYQVSDSDHLSTIVQTNDGGFLLGANLFIENIATPNDSDGSLDYWVFKIDSLGNVQWEETYGGSSLDHLVSLVETDDGGILLGGKSFSSDGDVGYNNGVWDIWIVKIRELKQRITTIAFYDENENSILDNSEQFIYNLPFTIEPTTGTILNNNEITIFFVDTGTYTVQYDSSMNNLWQTVENGIDNYTIEITDYADTTLYFPMQPVTDFLIQNVDITSSITRCNQETNVWLTYTNKSSESTSGYVNVVTNDLATFVSATPPVDSIAGDTLYWFYEDLYPTHSEQIKAIFEMAGVGEDGENVGENIVFDAQMETWEGDGNNKGYLSSELICAYDPNDKLVTPEGIGEENYTLFEDSLFNYTIRFQNTGNDTAFNITIQDTITEYLNMETYQFIASSHEVNTKINESERTIEFQFDDIYLPDSNVNEVGSHGFVKFSMKSNPNLAENTPIENTASIYFDFNPAIVTNTTSNTMVSELPTSLAEIQQTTTFQIYPNPNTGTFTINNENRSIQTIKIYDVMGKLIQEQKANNSQINVDIKENSGIYFLSLDTNEGVFVEKIIIQ